MEKHSEKNVRYGDIITVWLALVAMTSLIITLSSLNIGSLLLVLGIVFASIQGYLVFKVYISEGLISAKSEADRKIFNIFVSIAVVLIAVSFLLLFL